MFVERSRSPAKKLPGGLTHSGIYLALARRLLGLPDDYQDPTTVRVHAELDEQRKARRPDIRTLDGLFSEVLLAYATILPRQDPGKQGRDWVDLAYRALRSRHGTIRWPDDEPEFRADLAVLLQGIRSHPDHTDIRKIDLAIFGMLFLNALAWGGRIRSSAVTTVVNRIADAAEAGALAPFLQGIVEDRAASSLADVEAPGGIMPQAVTALDGSWWSALWVTAVPSNQATRSMNKRWFTTFSISRNAHL